MLVDYFLQLELKELTVVPSNYGIIVSSRFIWIGGGYSDCYKCYDTTTQEDKRKCHVRHNYFFISSFSKDADTLKMPEMKKVLSLLPINIVRIDKNEIMMMMMTSRIV